MVIINFVYRFVPDFAVMLKPIHNLLKKDRSFSWTDDIKNAFVRIKKAISSAPVLAIQILKKNLLYILMPQRKQFLLSSCNGMTKLMRNQYLT
jgi:hypothetical protein